MNSDNIDELNFDIDSFLTSYEQARYDKHIIFDDLDFHIDKKQKKEEEPEVLNPYSLQTFCILKITETLKASPSNENIESLSILPEECREYMGQVNCIDAYIDKYKYYVEKAHEVIGKQEDMTDYKAAILNLIPEIRLLFLKLISKNTEILPIFVKAIEELFDVLKFGHTNLDAVINSDISGSVLPYKIRFLKKFEMTLVKIKFILNSFLFPKRVNQENVSLLKRLAKNAGRFEKINVIELLTNFANRETLVQCFAAACTSEATTPCFIKWLHEKLKITKKELENCLSGFAMSWSESKMDKIEYLIELIQKYGLDIKKLINMHYTDEKFGLNYLLIESIYMDCPEKRIKYLLNEGADINVEDEDGKTALEYAQEKLNITLKQFCLGNISKEILPKINEMKNVVSILTKAKEEQSNQLSNEL